MNKTPLSRRQNEIMKKFYSLPARKVVFNKNEREHLWKKATSKSSNIDLEEIKERCPALEHQIRKSYKTGQNIQSAVFSECVYAQTFAELMGLPIFINCYESNYSLPSAVTSLLKDYHLNPRYIYSSRDKERFFIQAGGCSGIDSALITVFDLEIYTVEFKEPFAKTSEPDLPKYGEDGVLQVTDKWLEKYPQFEEMLNEQRGLNFFEAMGNNVNDFSVKSIDIAVTSNYINEGKSADIICTEDKYGYLVLLPTNQVSIWAEISGEIRPAGRNHYKVWTPEALKKFLFDIGATIDGNTVSVAKVNLGLRRERGGNRRISGYKINSLFFVYLKNCEEHNGIITFNFNNIRQLKPTIAGKMLFKDLQYDDLKSYYDLCLFSMNFI